MENISVGILGIGSYLPEKILTNRDLEKIVDTSDEWILTRTGIRERRICEKNQATSDIATIAAKRALEDANVKPEEIDCIILATITPDTLCPSTACYVQNNIGAINAAAFDINAACSGFIFGATIGKSMIIAGTAKKVLVIGTETLSKFTNWQDRTTCILFGDGAGAAVIGEVEKGRGFLAEEIKTDGSLTELIIIQAGGSRLPASPETVSNGKHTVTMKGNEVFKVAVKSMTDSLKNAINKSGYSIQDIKCVIPHQANIRIIEAIARRLDVPIERFYINLDKYGNTSAATIPIALDEAVKEGKIKRGDLIAFVAFGGGLTWGASVLIY